MKIEKQRMTSFRVMACLLMIVVAAGSCSKNSADPITTDIKTSVSDDQSQQTGEDEIDDISSVQLQSASNVGGKLSATDVRVACAKISTAVHDKGGSIIINFDSTSTGPSATGCMDSHGNVRKGQISITWQGKWYAAGSTILIELTNYSINGLSIGGQRTLTNITDPAHPFIIIWNVVATHNFTWSDNTTASRAVDKVKTWSVLTGTVTVSNNGTLPAVTGINREGKQYSVSITNDLLYTASCAASNSVFIPVVGTLQLTVNAAVIVVDFGTDTCDNIFSITYNNKTESFTEVGDNWIIN